MSSKRTDYLTWDEYFMSVAMLSSKRSKDPSTQVGCCIVGKDNRILSTGYNGAPNNFSDDTFPWEREGNPLDTKYMYVCHSEMNAIMNYIGPKELLKDARLYVTLFPCNEFAKVIVQGGVKEVIYLSDKYKDTDGNKAAARIFKECNVKTRKLVLDKKIELDMSIQE